MLAVVAVGIACHGFDASSRIGRVAVTQRSGQETDKESQNKTESGTMRKLLLMVVLVAVGSIGQTGLGLAIESVDVPEPSSALLLLSSVPVPAVGLRYLRSHKE
jgi:hypothetical protein